MADPVTALIAVAAVAAAGSAVMGAAGAKQQANAEAGAAQFNASIAREDAAISETQTQANIDRQGRENIARRGSQVAAAGASGGLSGSSFDIISDSVVQQELDILNIRHQGDLQKRGLLNTAGLEDARAKNVKKAGNIAAASQLLGGVSKVASIGAGR